MSTLAPPAIALLIPLLVVVVVALTARRAPGTDEPDDDGHDGGLPRDQPPWSPRPPGRADPDWWPEFERAFAAHVGEHLATQRA